MSHPSAATLDRCGVKIPESRVNGRYGTLRRGRPASTRRQFVQDGMGFGSPPKPDVAQRHMTGDPGISR